MTSDSPAACSGASEPVPDRGTGGGRLAAAQPQEHRTGERESQRDAERRPRVGARRCEHAALVAGAVTRAGRARVATAVVVTARGRPVIATVVVAKMEGEFDETKAVAEYQQHFKEPALARL